MKDNYPIPKIENLLIYLRSAKFFTTLDLASGYHQVKIKEGDRYKTAFITEFGLFMFIVMAFGLCNAPTTFQRLMEKVLHEYLYKFVVVYFDDVIIFSMTEDEHVVHLRLVLLKLREHVLKIQWKKCRWGLSRIEYLGLMVDNGTISPAPKKIDALLNFERPTTSKKLSSFLGLANYYRKFIKNFAAIADPLFKSISKNSKISWTPACEDAFVQLKTILSSFKSDSEENGILALPNFEHPFILETDASNIGVGAVLSQKIDSVTRPIGYYSKPLSTAQRNYAVIERELYALVVSIEHFKITCLVPSSQCFLIINR